MQTTEHKTTTMTIRTVHRVLNAAGFSVWSWPASAPHNTRGFSIEQRRNIIAVVYTGNQNGQPTRYAKALRKAGIPCTFSAGGVRIEK